MTGTQIRALLYDGQASHAEPVSIEIEGHAGNRVLVIRSKEITSGSPVSELVIGERVGETNRYLQLSTGGSLEVLDNQAFDESLRAAGLRTAEEPIRILERHWRYAVIAGISVVLVSVGFLRFGLPAIASRAVRLIPPGVDSLIAQDTLRVLDRTTFSPSKLSAERKAQISALFARVTGDAGPNAATFRLEFRTGGAIEANALALPSGVVVLTDELVALTKNDDELLGVFAHEVGHLIHRHAMRMLVQSSASAVLLAGIFGDASAASSVTAAAPALLVSSAYSRDFERQADKFAFDWMAAHKVSPRHLGDLLKRVAGSQGSDAGGYLASHPDLEERVQAASR